MLKVNAQFYEPQIQVHAFLPLPYFISTEPVASLFCCSRSTAERDHCFSGNQFIFNTITLIQSQNFYQNVVLISETILTLHIIKKRIHYCCTLDNWILPYWKLQFFSANFKILYLKKYWANFVQNCKMYPTKLTRLTG